MKRFFSLILLVCLCALMGACSDNSTAENRTDLDFTVVTRDQIPGELLQILETKKEGNFALTYTDGSWLYIAIGAGKQPTGGYSYAIQGLWLGDNAIHIDADLLGPSAQEQTTKVPSYPYVVVKLEHREEPVVFQ
ncbi:MAG: protease complex subunit PrcB family protein [Lachnospiraceae bacterium]|nr:protease complex subunit PrcB family protein [Lachnospiraceae bacterium]